MNTEKVLHNAEFHLHLAAKVTLGFVLGNEHGPYSYVYGCRYCRSCRADA